MTDKTEVRSLVTGFHLEDTKGETFPIKLISTIGRDSECDLVITEGFVSRQHARILVKGDEVWLEDLGSTNGTFINKERITEPVRVDENAEIKFDTVVYFLRKPVSRSDQDARTAIHDVESEAGKDATQLGDTQPLPESTAATPAASKEAPLAPVNGGMEGEARKVPPSWLENKESPNKTRVMSGTEIQEKLAEAAKAKVSLDGINDNDGDSFRLVIANGSARGKVLPLQTQGASEAKWVVGRDAGLDISIDDSSISSQHFQIIHNRGRWKLVNLMAANGTFVNQERRLSCYLSDGDLIGAGDVEFVFQAPAGAKQPGAETVPTSVKASPQNRYRLLWIAAAVIVCALLLVLLLV